MPPVPAHTPAYTTRVLPRALTLALGLLIALACAAPAQSQGIDPEGRLIRTVKYEGLSRVKPKLLDNTTNTKSGTAYRAATIREDIVNITFLGQFETVEAKVEDNGDGSINVVFVMKELPALQALRFEGGRRFDNKELRTLVLLDQGDPIDPSLIDRGATAIEQAYSEKGHFAATVTFDKQALEEKGELVYQITEGPRVRVSEFRFEGNDAFDDDTLDSQVISEEYWWPFIAGFLDRDKLDFDVATLRNYYRDRGYLDAQVGRRIELSPRQNRAIVTFEINEGEKHTVRDIKVQFIDGGQPTDDQLMSEQQIKMVLDLVRGGAYSDERVESSRDAIELWYGWIGFINTRVQIDQLFDPDRAVVDVLVTIDEGTGPTTVGDVIVIGLTRTQQKVLLRRIEGLEPGRPVIRAGLDQTRKLVEQSTWFTGGKVTALGEPDDPIRDYLIEANERNTGSFSIGAGLSSDAGVFGAIGLTQRNFDIADWPESMDEFLAQRAFLGAGQTFSINIQPGNEISNYSLGFREPYLFESNYFFDLNLYAFNAVREDFDEGRLGIRTSLGRRLGDIWTGSVRLRYEELTIDDIEPDAPVDAFAVAGSNPLTAIGFALTRSTTDSNITPSRGSRLTVGVDQFGALGGDFDYTRFTMNYDQFWTLFEDFLGRKNILSLKVDVGYIPQDSGEVPLTERFYSGGRQFRGFEFRGVGPRGVRNDTGRVGDDPVGGQFEFITRLQYEFPVYDKFLRWAVFTDQGTIQDDIGFDQWRVAIGTGVRLNVPFFGQAPIAVDFAVPLIDEEGDESELISFSIELPFN